MIDSHSHIYCNDFDTDRDEVIARARQAGVRHIVLPNENLASVGMWMVMLRRISPPCVPCLTTCTPWQWVK